MLVIDITYGRPLWI